MRMSRILKYYAFSVAATAVSICDLAIAQDCYQDCDVPPPCVQECLAPGYSCCEITEGLYLEALIWRANADGLALGKEILVRREGLDSTTGNYANVIKDSKVRNLKFDDNVGDRLGAFFNFPRTSWDILCEWTQFFTKASVSGNSRLDPNNPPGDSYYAFVPYWESLAQNFPNHARARYNLNINLVDVEFGRDFGLSTCFLLRPNFGLRFAQFNQKYKVKSFANQSGVFNSASYDYTSHVKARSDFAAVGPRLGCDAEFRMGCGFALFGKAAGSLVYGRFDSHSHEYFNNNDFFFYQFEQFEEHAHHSKDDWRSRAITDLSIGLKYEYCFACGCKEYPISLAVSWEHHAFYDFNDFNFNSQGFTNTIQDNFEFGPYANLLPSPKKCGDIFTEGVTISLGVGF